MYNFTDLPNRKNQGCVKWDRADTSYGMGSTGLLPMWIADMDFEVAPPIIEAVQRRVDNKVFGYDFLTEEYFQSVMGWMKRRHHYDVAREEIIFTPGIVTALHMGVKAVTEPGDQVLVTTPVYGPFFGAVTDEGRQLLDVPLSEKDGYYTMDFEAMEKAVTPKTRAMLFCSPHNPGGRVWTRQELEQLDAFCQKHNIFMIADEIHNDLVFSGQHTVYGNISEYARNHSIICTAPSKTFNLAGIQSSSMLIANKEVRERFQAQVSAAHASANIFAGPATIAAYTQCDTWLDELLVVLRDNCQYLTNFVATKLPQLKIRMNEGTYLMWLDCRGLGMSEEELGKFFAEKCGVAANVGSWFGANGACFRRINVACPRSMLEDCCQRIEKAVKGLGK